MRHKYTLIENVLKTAVLALFLAGGLACTRDQQEIVSDSPRGSGQSDQISQSEGPSDSSSHHHVVGDGAAEMMVPVMETSLRSTIDLDMDNLKYRFKYLSVNREDDLKFENGRASIKLSGLPTGQSDDIVFEILENNVVRLRGVDRNKTLTPGRNTSNIRMELVGAGELEVDLIIGDGDGRPPQDGNPPQDGRPPENDNPPQDVTPPQQENGEQDNGSNQLPEEIANWDGLSDRPSERWRIENLPLNND